MNLEETMIRGPKKMHRNYIITDELSLFLLIFFSHNDILTQRSDTFFNFSSLMILLCSFFHSLGLKGLSSLLIVLRF
jgi:hypothetical protein